MSFLATTCFKCRIHEERAIVGKGRPKIWFNLWSAAPAQVSVATNGNYTEALLDEWYNYDIGRLKVA